MLAGELAAELGARLVDALREHVRVWPREIHMLEHAVRVTAGRKRAHGLHTFRTNDQHLARFDIANPLRVDQVQRARLRADNVRVTKAAECERPEAVRIAYGDEPILREEHEREGTLHLRNGL